jgi:hypothetical protein
MVKVTGPARQFGGVAGGACGCRPSEVVAADTLERREQLDGEVRHFPHQQPIEGGGEVASRTAPRAPVIGAAVVAGIHVQIAPGPLAGNAGEAVDHALVGHRDDLRLGHAVLDEAVGNADLHAVGGDGVTIDGVGRCPVRIGHHQKSCVDTIVIVRHRSSICGVWRGVGEQSQGSRRNLRRSAQENAEGVDGLDGDHARWNRGGDVVVLIE